MAKSLLLLRFCIITGLLLLCASLARAQGTITTVAGNGQQGSAGDNGPATSAQLSLPVAVLLDAAGNLYIDDGGSFRIRKVSSDGTITTVAGNGQQVYSGDGGPATSAGMDPHGIALDAATGNLYIADYFNNRIRKVTPSGTISTFAGTGSQGFAGDGGQALNAQLAFPAGVAVDSNGNVYIADMGNVRIRRVSSAGVISTVAGRGTQGFSGDGGPAISAQLNVPLGVTVDSSGNLYIADSGNSQSRIRKVTSAGTISTFAGVGTLGFSGDGGPAISAQLNSLFSTALDSSGNLYIPDAGNGRVRKVAVDGTISTVAGNGVGVFAGDGGPATSASLTNPRGVVADSAGNLYIADSSNRRVRKVTYVVLPAINPGGLVNGASFNKLPPAASSIASLFGTSFGSAVNVATTLPLPTTLGGVSVIIKSVATTQSGVATKSVLPVGGIAAPLFSVSPGQINFQVPAELSDQTQATAAVSLNGLLGNAITFNVSQYNPAIFATNQQGTGQGVVLIASSGELVAPTGSIPGRAARPAKRGEYVTIYCTGLGPVTNQPADGAAALSNPLSVTTTSANVTLGDVPVPQTDGYFAGLAPTFVGLYQVNFQIPQNAATGDAVPLTLSIGGVTSNTVTIAVQ